LAGAAVVPYWVRGVGLSEPDAAVFNVLDVPLVATLRVRQDQKWRHHFNLPVM
jgi:hypothetical protein